MTWKVFSYDQAKTIKENKALAACGDGACLAISMKYCVVKKHRVSSLHFEDKLNATQLAQWMKDVQDVPLATLFKKKLFKYYAQNEAITEVNNNTEGKINNLKAYSYRLAQMSQWAKDVGLVLQDDRVGFPGDTERKHWVQEIVKFATSLSAAHSFGLIFLTGEYEGHTMAFERKTSPNTVINFFDPNEGEYRSTSAQQFQTWLTSFFKDNYDDLEQHWWVILFK